MAATGFSVEYIEPGTFFDRFKPNFQSTTEFNKFCLDYLYTDIREHFFFNRFIHDFDALVSIEKFKTYKKVETKMKALVKLLNTIYAQTDEFRLDDDNKYMFFNMNQEDWFVGLIHEEDTISFDVMYSPDTYNNGYRTFEGRNSLVVMKDSPLTYITIHTNEDDAFDVKCFEYLFDVLDKGWERLC